MKPVKLTFLVLTLAAPLAAQEAPALRSALPLKAAFAPTGISGASLERKEDELRRELKRLAQTQGRKSAATADAKDRLARVLLLPEPFNPLRSRYTGGERIIYSGDSRYHVPPPSYERQLPYGLPGITHLSQRGYESMLTRSDARARLRESEKLFKEAGEVRSTTLGAAHPTFAIALNNQAVARVARGEWKKSVKLFEEAWRILESSADATASDLRITSDNLAMLYEQLQRKADAQRIRSRADELLKPRV